MKMPGVDWGSRECVSSKRVRLNEYGSLDGKYDEVILLRARQCLPFGLGK